MSVFVDVVNSVVELGQTVSDFFTGGIYDLIVAATAWFVKWAVAAMWSAKLAALEFSWDVAQELLTSLNISSHLNNAWNSLNSQVLQLLTFFRVPEALNIVFSAATTKFVFRFLGFS